METFIQQLLNGLTIGGIYALIALGYTMVYGILKLINFAHGDIFMIGAFSGLLATMWITDSFIVAIIVAMVTCGILGIVVERIAYRPLRDPSAKAAIVSASGLVIIIGIAVFATGDIANTLLSPAFWIGAFIVLSLIVLLIRNKVNKANSTGNSRINALISAIGMSIIISNMVVLIKGPSREVFPKLIPEKIFSFLGFNFSLSQAFIIVVSFILMGILFYTINKTKFGLSIRAVLHNAETARLMGINPDKAIS